MSAEESNSGKFILKYRNLCTLQYTDTNDQRKERSSGTQGKFLALVKAQSRTDHINSKCSLFYPFTSDTSLLVFSSFAMIYKHVNT